MSSEYDLDVSFADEPAAPDLSGLTADQLDTAVNALPVALQGVARGILIEKRTMSDVSQEQSIRQAELVQRLHRAKLAIAEQKL